MIWIRNQLDVTFVLSFISPLQVAQHVSGNHVPIFRSWRLYSVIVTSSYSPMDTHYLLTGSDSLPAATAQHQHVAITLRNCQLLKMGTWLPETWWTTCKGENKRKHKSDNYLVSYPHWITMHGQPNIRFTHQPNVCFVKFGSLTIMLKWRMSINLFVLSVFLERVQSRSPWSSSFNALK